MTPDPDEHAIPRAVGDEDTEPTILPRAATTSPGEHAGSRPFVVLVADHPDVAKHARATCGARGVMLVWVALPATLKTLAAGMTPTHVVVDGVADRLDAACLRDLEARGVRIRFCRCVHETFEALAEIS